MQSAGPIDAMARAVWRALPFRVRRRASVATWAFDNANRFDLVALPKLAGVGASPPTWSSPCSPDGSRGSADDHQAARPRPRCDLFNPEGSCHAGTGVILRAAR